MPASIVVLGGGPVGVELGQLFCRFGVEVTLVEGADHLVNREDPAVGALILEVLREEGIDVRLRALAERVHVEDGERVVTLSDGQQVRAQELLVATGRTPRVDGIGLDSVGIDANRNGIEIDEHCRAAEAVCLHRDPRVVFSDPEIAAVGLTERQAPSAIDPPTSRCRCEDSREPS